MNYAKHTLVSLILVKGVNHLNAKVVSPVKVVRDAKVNLVNPAVASLVKVVRDANHNVRDGS